MKYKKSFKLLLSLVLSFVFMFGNALFIKAEDSSSNNLLYDGVTFDEVVDIPELWIDSGEGDSYCSREYVPLTESKDSSYFWEQSNFDYELVDEGRSAFVKLQGKLIKRDTAGNIELERYIETNFIFIPPTKK